MSAYYRTTDGRVLDLTAEQIAALAPSKRDTLRRYTEDPRPTPSAAQRVAPGPVVVTPTQAHKTWVLVDLTAEELALIAFRTLQTSQLELARQVYAALKNGTGTAGERLTRVERVCAHYLRGQFGSEPA